ncbi:unnamed protein product [Penicillium salamii]|uniref:Uncharacterized protein n=1 Tax=Penicillium salamii TaxID=1612424 RepID=A0A9W4NN08_9EURO|nr:unnamed protein product [Penicillium salamii]CAG8258143.1 unnamed protein product [Penicillium salamii]CAG8313653.1 unnamed protein product [Penicillium salamii]CAG8359761.1 unnamed protein product [Penicillium salamii]CAG8387561.1 unnamed protein product [Penicillium salamii]
MTVVIKEAVLPDQAVKSILPISQCDFASDDKPPLKRRKITKAGPWNLSQENGISTTGIPLGYIPVARLTLRMKLSTALLEKHSVDSEIRIPVIVSASSDSQHGTGGKPSCTQLEVTNYSGEQLIFYSCCEPALLDLTKQIELACNLTPADRSSTRAPVACHQVYLRASPGSEYLSLETVILWTESLETPDINKLQDSTLEVFTQYVIQGGSLLSSMTDPASRREAMLGQYREWTPREFYNSVHVPDAADTLAQNLKFPGMECDLFPFQKRAVRWLLRREGRDVQEDGRLAPIETSRRWQCLLLQSIVHGFDQGLIPVVRCR